MRWPTIHWRLASFYATADAGQRAVVDAMFDGFNLYLGNYIGEFLGEFAFSAFFLLTSWAMLRPRSAPPILAIAGLATGALGIVGMFRNVTPAVAPVAAINNYLLPLWMIVFGVLLLRMHPDTLRADAA
jgi:drug/metabolite transporter (DMT)-like permease